METKFRAWEKESKKMYYKGDGKTMEDKDSWFTDSINAVNSSLESSRIDWMQYTGLKDNKGKEIYEGDLCSIGSILAPANGKIRGKIEYRNGVFVLEGIKENRLWYLYELEINNFYLEIEGNIYENENLIK